MREMWRSLLVLAKTKKKYIWKDNEHMSARVGLYKVYDLWTDILLYDFTDNIRVSRDFYGIGIG